ncbi:DNA-directed DNA polymerase alpha catalytic subunit pol1 [Cryptotrichosporon argae]
MPREAAKTDRFAALRDARARGGRASQWQPEEAALYDEVTDAQYASIVGDRLEQDDFIDDDDGGGYVDHGEEWAGEEQEESEDEDGFEGEDDEYKQARKLKRAKARAKAAKAGAASASTSAPAAAPRKSTALSDYARPAGAAASTYRPPAANEDDFMASLLSAVSAQPAPLPTSAARRSVPAKRQSSPDWPSSEPAAPSSDSVFGPRKRYGESDDEGEGEDDGAGERRWPVPRARGVGKKPRVSEATVVPDYDDGDGAGDIDMGVASEGDAEVKAEPVSDDDDDDEVAVRQVRPARLVGRPAARRSAVNSSSVKHVKAEPVPVVEAAAEAKAGPGAASLLPKAERAHWSSVQDALVGAKPELPAAPAAGASKAEHVLDGTGGLRMFWFDFYEQDGVVHLFGKGLDRQANKWVSTCVSVRGIQRNLFVKPRAKRHAGGHETDVDVSKTDVYDEFDGVRRRAGVDEWAAKFVERKYAFEDARIARGESEWMKVVYGFDAPEIPDTSGATFSHVFGARTTAFEQFVVKRKIMGPCWLDIKGAAVSAKPLSWCKAEFEVANPKLVAVVPDSDAAAPKDTPPLTIMSIALRTIVNHRENKTEILCATTRTWEGCNIEDPTPPDRLASSQTTIVRPIEKFPPGLEQLARTGGSPFQVVKAERALLNALLATVQRHDPDVIVGHSFLGGSFEALLYRMKELKADHWSRIGRFRRKAFQISKMGSNVRLLAGRLVADLSSDAAKGMIASTTWSLTEMVASHLKVQREDVDPEDTHTYFDHTLSSPDKLVKFIRLCEVDAFFQMAIAARVQMLPLTKQLTNLAGNSWQLTLNGGRAVRNEFILLHEFHRLKYVCPDKQFTKRPAKIVNEDGEEEDAPVRARGKAKYVGGLVFEPKRGLWDTYILVMDFNSLYPSIIQEYNIDFTTVERSEPAAAEGDDDAAEEKIPDVPAGDAPQGVLPRIIATLVSRRRQVKALMKDRKATAAQVAQWDIKQQALKLTANSMYGCLGFAGSRFSSRPLAALTTFKGREILTHTRELAESLGLDVVYGDTDSVFVNSNVTAYADALKIATDFKKLVNERYRLLEIDLDATFERVLLLNKKKYAAVKIDETGNRSTEVKGLDMKRREYSKVSKDVSAAVLKEILSGDATENVIAKIHDYLTTLGENVRNGLVPLDDFIIFKRLGKNPEDYPDKKSQPHVQVALRLKQKGTAVRAHDVIPYIMCLGEDGKASRTAQADRAFHPDDLRRQGSDLRIDFDFYLDTQILQPVLRLCESIEGTERARLAQCLGLDPARYASTSAAGAGGDATERQFFTFDSQVSDAERFKDADALGLRCPACDAHFTYTGIAPAAAASASASAGAGADGEGESDGDAAGTPLSPAGIQCPACRAALHPASVAVQVELAVRAHVSRFYAAWTVCDGEACGARTRAAGVYGRRCVGLERDGGAAGCRGTVRLEYPDAKLYNQLLYLRALFDADKALDAVRGSARADDVRATAAANVAVLGAGLGAVDKYLDRNGRRYVDMGGLFGFMARIKL